MSTWVGMGPVIGPGSLDGFAIGVMMSGACFLAITVPRRARRRQAVAAGAAGMLAAGPRAWLPGRARAPRASRDGGVCEARAFDSGALEPGAFEAGAFGPGPFGAGPFAPGAERLARPDETSSLNEIAWAGSVADDDRTAGGRRNRHRLNEPLPGTTSPDRTPRGGTAPGGGPRGGAVPGGAPRASSAFPDSAFPDSAFPESALPESELPDCGFPDVAFPDEASPDSGWPEPLPDGERPGHFHDSGWLESFPDDAPRDGWPGRPEPSPGEAPRDSGRLEPLPDMPRDGGRRREPAFPDWAARDGVPFPSGASRDRARPDVELPDIAFPDGTFGTSKRPEARRLPRHAAPAVGLGAKMSHWMTGLFARPLASGARG
jgi:hypothetical protein